MGQVINPDPPIKIRNNRRRLIAEILHRLGQKQRLDSDVRDMTAAIYAAITEIDETVEQTVVAWEKRDYWVKADRFRLDWEWVNEAKDLAKRILDNGKWDDVPLLIVHLIPHFQDYKIKRYVYGPQNWRKAYFNYCQKNGVV